MPEYSPKTPEGFFDSLFSKESIPEGFYTSNQLADKYNISVSVMQVRLRKLLREGAVSCRKYKLPDAAGRMQHIPHYGPPSQ